MNGFGAKLIFDNDQNTYGASTCNYKFNIAAIPEPMMYNCTESKFNAISRKNGTTFEIEFLRSLQIAAPDKYEKVREYLEDVRMDLSIHEVKELLKV